MIDYLNISYGELMLRAVVPAFLFFFAVFLIVHFRSVKIGIQPLSPALIPSLGAELKARGNMLLPIGVLVVLLGLQFSVMYAGFLAVAAALVVCQFRPSTRLDAAACLRAFGDAMNGMLTLLPVCAGAGVLIGVMTATGLNLKLTYLIEDLAQGRLFPALLLTMVASIVLGMGLPTVAAYVVLATLIPATLTKLGILPIAAHLFLFYFAILSAITPPVCTGAYVAAGIANTDPVRTGFTAIRLGAVCLLLPFAFVYEPALLLIGTPSRIALHLGTCAVGILFWAVALEGHWRGPLPALPRVILLVSGVLLIWPDPWISTCGAVLGALAVVLVAGARRAENRPRTGHA
jgi:TRAP transporter 4TM/12TM fusion protein